MGKVTITVKNFIDTTFETGEMLIINKFLDTAAKTDWNSKD